MALSNIFREPRREITEQVFGTAAVGIPIAFVWWASGQVPDGWYDATSTLGYIAERGLTMLGIAVAGAIGLIIVVGLALLTHSVGEDICNALARRGADPRPRQRR